MPAPITGYRLDVGKEAVFNEYTVALLLQAAEQAGIVQKSGFERSSFGAHAVWFEGTVESRLRALRRSIEQLIRQSYRRLPPKVHSHRCPRCGARWHHGRKQAQKNPGAHRCPTCGTPQYVVEPRHA